MPHHPADLLAPGQLLVVTHLGQVLVFDAHRGTVVGTPLDLVDGVDPTDSQRGLGDCQPAGRAARSPPRPPSPPQTRHASCSGCGSPTPTAPVLVGLRYRPGQTPLLTREWTSDAVGGGPLASPVLSADGRTVYVNGRDEPLWAVNSRRRQGEMVGADWAISRRRRRRCHRTG